MRPDDGKLWVKGEKSKKGKVYQAMHILLVNMSALILGTVIGCLLKKYVPEKLQENSMIYFSIVTLVLGIRLIERTTHSSSPSARAGCLKL